MLCDYREPSLDEVMEEPIIQAMMERDSVGRGDLLDLLDRVRATYGAPEEFPSRSAIACR